VRSSLQAEASAFDLDRAAPSVPPGPPAIPAAGLAGSRQSRRTVLTERHVEAEPDHDRQGERPLAERGRAELSGGVFDEFGFQNLAQAGEGEMPK